MEMDYVVKNIFKTRVRTGVDAKLLQYDTNSRNVCERQIDLVKILETHLFKEKLKTNCIMINLEKDVDRYKKAVDELKKVSINNFIHLKGTWWKEKSTMEKDLTMIKEFLKQFNSEIDDVPIMINEFSEINDPNIKIQDGPLGCYTSHLRAMMYGYLNFEKYTIIVEDDISITNTDNIEKYLQCIPDNWDIITLGCIGKNRIYEEPYYKFTDDFHSTHFYIINHKCMEKLLNHMYPINDQVDVLIAELVNELNIYNIPDTVYQKCISTNTQNNLHTIFNAKYYDVLRNEIDKIKRSCLFFANRLIPDNETNNEIIISNLLYDVVYSYITDSDIPSDGLCISNKNKDNTDYVDEYVEFEEYADLFMSMAYFIQCSKKAINIESIVRGLINDIFCILRKFRLHNTFNIQYNGTVKAYRYGASSQTYLVEENLKKKNIIIKAYNDKLRWISKNHNDSDELFEKEVRMLQKNLSCAPKLLSFDREKKIIAMSYCGESLYDSFNLPENWKEQIHNIFYVLSENHIYYPEFKLHNILVLDGIITFIDFGLAICDEKLNNNENYNKFIEYLSLLNEKMRGIDSREKRQQLYSTFVHNMKITNF